jgi:hypothetical protein
MRGYYLFSKSKEKKQFKKRTQKILDCLPKDFTTVSLDESFFLFDSLVRRVWIYKTPAL